MQSENFMDGVWESTFFFVNPIENYRETKEICDIPVISQIMGIFFSLSGLIFSLGGIISFAIPQGINIVLKKIKARKTLQT